MHSYHTEQYIPCNGVIMSVRCVQIGACFEHSKYKFPQCYNVRKRVPQTQKHCPQCYNGWLHSSFLIVRVVSNGAGRTVARENCYFWFKRPHIMATLGRAGSYCPIACVLSSSNKCLRCCGCCRHGCQGDSGNTAVLHLSLQMVKHCIFIGSFRFIHVMALIAVYQLIYINVGKIDVRIRPLLGKQVVQERL